MGAENLLTYEWSRPTTRTSAANSRACGGQVTKQDKVVTVRDAMRAQELCELRNEARRAARRTAVCPACEGLEALCETCGGSGRLTEAQAAKVRAEFNEEVS